ncbi:hypothetical protein QYE76_025731 [Lolium multiflorum]|uniref:RNase H type-1 domain-containing protein n=1 Tax=Lolium multiflorum TaxID=4521 RepID=A0AAD8RHC7_LOLMU|nr:hypothetical protein QYE76_025731 [Lolium multiflorum]
MCARTFANVLSSALHHRRRPAALLRRRRRRAVVGRRLPLPPPEEVGVPPRVDLGVVARVGALLVGHRHPRLLDGDVEGMARGGGGIGTPPHLAAAASGGLVSGGQGYPAWWRRTNPVKLSIVPIGGIHIFIGETVDSDGNALVSHADATAAEQDAVAKIRSEMQELPKEGSALDLEISTPTQSAPEQEIMVEDQCRSAWVSQVLEKQRCHLHFLAHTAEPPLPGRSGPMQVGCRRHDTPDQQDAAGDNDAPYQQEDAGDKEESILGNLSPTSDDATTLDTEEYNRLTKELEGDQEAEAESAPPKQVLATITGLEQEADEETPTDVGLLDPSTSETPPTRPRYRVAPESGEGHISGHTEYMSADELVEQAGRGAIAHSEILNKPITPDEAAYPEVLEAKRKEMLATTKVFANTAAAMLEERQEAGAVMESFLKRESEAAKCLAEAKKFRAQWETMMEDAGKEADRIRREAIGPRKINFATPTNQQPLATPKDNMKKAAEILAKKDEEIDIAHLRTLVASAMKQQSKADTSRRLESNPDLCVSTAQKDASGRQHRDDESRTGSMERRRRTREHLNPIPVPSKTPPTDPRKGKDLMYTGRDKYQNPSPPPRNQAPPPPPHRRSPVGNTRPHGPDGINIRDNVVPQRNRNTERTRNLVGAGMKNVSRSPAPERRRRPPSWGRNECENVDNRTAMHAFIGGLQRGGLLWHKLTCLINENKLTLDDMIGIASTHSAADDDAGGELAATAIPLHQQKKNRDNGGSSNSNKRKNPPDDQKSGGSDMVAMAFQRGALRILNATSGYAAYVRWSENLCTFDRADHLTIIPKECYALVVSPCIDGFDFSKCLMDGGASLNIMYLETLEKMQLTKEQLKHSNTEFHGVVLGKKANSLGSIRLPVAFGDVNNFHEEMITFEVVPFKSSYHVIFGRLTYHKFHARVCYIYNTLKIPGPNAPAESEPMLLYLAASNKIISLVIVVERKEEGSQELRHYFQEHPMTVVSKAPLSTILNNADATGRTAKWGIELSAFDINYKARTAIKSQILADFVVDWTEAPDAELEPEPETWVMHFDGSKQHQDSRARVTLKSPTGEELQYVLQIHFEATNNMAEYEALLHGMRIAKEIGIKHIICCGDSDLVAQQVAGTWNARNSIIAAYRDEVDEIAKCFLGYEVKYVRRDDNTAADMLSKLGSGRKPIPPGIFLEHLRIPLRALTGNPDVAVSLAKEVMVIILAWTQPFLDYLIDQKLPEDEVLAR